MSRPRHDGGSTTGSAGGPQHSATRSCNCTLLGYLGCFLGDFKPLYPGTNSAERRWLLACAWPGGQRAEHVDWVVCVCVWGGASPPCKRVGGLASRRGCQYLNVAPRSVGRAAGPPAHVRGIALHQHNIGLDCRREVQREGGRCWPARCTDDPKRKQKRKHLAPHFFLI